MKGEEKRGGGGKGKFIGDERFIQSVGITFYGKREGFHRCLVTYLLLHPTLLLLYCYFGYIVTWLHAQHRRKIGRLTSLSTCILVTSYRPYQFVRPMSSFFLHSLFLYPLLDDLATSCLQLWYALLLLLFLTPCSSHDCFIYIRQQFSCF